MVRPAVFIFASAVAITPSLGRENRQLVPEGWHLVQSYQGENTRRYVSPDGRSFLTLGDADAGLRDIAAEMAKIARQPGETVTYEKSERSWVVVSGYRNDEIFYRRGNLACGGTRWHLIELKYPRQDKRRMDTLVSTISHRLSQFHDACPSRANHQ
jgi:hypothetical protein